MADDAATVEDSVPAGDAAAEPAEQEVRDERREELLGRFTDILGDAVVTSHVDPGADLTIRVRTDAWRAAADVARNRLGARYFCFLSAIDWLPSPWGRSNDSAVDDELAARAGNPVPPRSDEIVQGVTGGDTRFQVLARVAHVGGGDGTFWGVTLKADVGDADGSGELEIESWVPIYAGADWHERECWEMFGITFVDHPGLRHMYLPGDFEGHPLRKDFPLLSRMVKPWPGIVDVEPMPVEDSDDESADAGATAGEGAEG